MKSKIIICAIAALCAGCAYTPSKMEVDAKHTTMQETLTKRQEAIVPESTNRAMVKRVSGNWLGVKVMPLGQDAHQPSVYRMPVTMNYPGRYNIRSVAELITKSTGVPVTIKPDVFLPLSAFVRNPQQNSGQAGEGANAAPLTTGLSMYSQSNASDDMELSFVHTPLRDVLNKVESRFGITSSYKEGEGIVLSRLITRTFLVTANRSDTASLGRATLSTVPGESGGGSSAGASNTQALTNTEGGNTWSNLEKVIDTIKSPVGKFFVNQASGTVTITDTADVVNEVRAYVDNENAIMTQQVGIRVDVLSVTASDQNELDLNWNAVFTKMNDILPKWSINVMSPSSLSSALTGGFGMSILTPPKAGSTLAQLGGTDAMLNALQGYARVTDRQTLSAMTLNRKEVPLSQITQLSYLARTVPGGNAGSGSSTLPGLEPGVVTTGFVTNIVPTVLPDNTVLLQFSIDSSQLKTLKVISTGAGATLQSIQTPEVDAVKTDQTVKLRSGATLVLTGLESEVMQYEQRSLGEHIATGGSYNGRKVKKTYIIMITPVIVDGA